METTFASRVREFRKLKGLSQEEFAKQCDLTQGNIAQMENGTEPKQSNVAKLVSGFPDLSPDWLLMGAGPMLRDGKALTPVAPPPAAVPAEAYAKDLVAQAENVLLRDQVAMLKEHVAILKEELGKFGGSSDAAGWYTEPRAPRGRRVMEAA